MRKTTPALQNAPPVGSSADVHKFLSQGPPRWDWTLIANLEPFEPGSLWQGTMPPPGPHAREVGFDVVVLCAVEYQPSPTAYPGCRVILAPNNDDGVTEPTEREMLAAAQAAREVSSHFLRGRSVLVTCRMGLNRSGLVTALALSRAKQMSGRVAADLVRKARPGALENRWFARILDAIP